ncbi:MAG: glycine cleavage system aminomethyltransferase GcvT [Chloroflexi bacterium]|nr:glycine cleavage system aminomethyltransferase GcvT [Chloroflexota bacterium]
MKAIDHVPLDYLFDDGLAETDPALDVIVGREDARQRDKLIMIPSESVPPRAVREALATAFTSVYAEGYPALRMAREGEDQLADVPRQLATYRRYADRRYYKGTELANLVEALAQRRCAQLFANERAPVEHIHVNVQPLSGAAANNAVYEAVCRPGDVVMGMQLAAGGHLSHGSPINRSGKHYRIISYGVNPRTGRLDYDAIADLAREHRPRMIIGGATSYPWDIDWQRLRAIADEVGARLLADIAHPAGLVVAGLFPNPVGVAHVTTFTTHKTLLGPRAAAVVTTDPCLAHKIDRAVFPGEQGGPHVNAIAAMAICFGVARLPQFHELQRRTVTNAQALATALVRNGLTIAYGGTNTHLLVVDLNAVKTPTGYPLKGDVVARILDLCGIVCNKNTIPGDAHAGVASAIRLGTTWLSQRGLGPAEMERIAEAIARIVHGIQPFRYVGPNGDVARGKIDPATLDEVRREVADVVAGARRPAVAPRSATVPADGTRAELVGQIGPALQAARGVLLLSGERAGAMLQETTAGDVLALAAGQSVDTVFLRDGGSPLAAATILRLVGDRRGDRYAVLVPAGRLAAVECWLSDLSDGFIVFDRADLYAKVQGPVVVERIDEGAEGPPGGASVAPAPPRNGQDELPGPAPVLSKPYFVGQRALLARLTTPVAALPEFQHADPDPDAPLKRTPLYEEHVKLTAARNLVPFAGWSMPVWYTAISEEHQAVRTAAGLFDIAHMGVVEVAGPGATRFLDLVTTNYVPMLDVGFGHYSYVLGPDGSVMDDVYVYRLEPERYMVVVNAANEDKMNAWLQAVNHRSVRIDRDHPGRTVDARPMIRDLKDPSSGGDRRVDLALQGPASLRILVAAAPAMAGRLVRLQKNQSTRIDFGGADVLVSRTGYTGEEMGFELYVHPDRAAPLWQLLLAAGRPFGLRATGLGARDSTRTEAGFPLYGHDLAGPYDISPMGAGYGAFVKLHKPFFVGRQAFIEREARRTMQLARFRILARGVRMVRLGDPVVSKRGECIGHVTSAALVEGHQVGLAYVSRQYAQEGTPVAIYALPRTGASTPELPVAQLRPGARVHLPEEAVIFGRFRAPSTYSNGSVGG